MKVVLAGAFGHLGSDILRVLVREGHEVVAVGREIRRPADCAEGYETRQIDVTKPESFEGVCDGAGHGITVAVTEPASGYAVRYGTTAGSCDLEKCPTYAEAGVYTAVVVE